MIAMDEDEDELQCPICLETVDEALSPPCRCQVSYCSGCLDRALAQSFNACGQARCPTCRTPVRVDFDASALCLTFALEEDAMEQESCGGSPEELHRERQRAARERITRQARPAQVELLRRYGEARPWFRAEAEEPCRGDPWPDLCMRAALAPPRCVCGGLLERLSSKERVCRVISRHWPDVPHNSLQFEQAVFRIVEQRVTFCSCDLCFESIKPPGHVWTCRNGNQTILHANAYDICEKCLISHAIGKPEPSTLAPEGS